MNDARGHSPTLKNAGFRSPDENQFAEPEFSDGGWPWRKIILFITLVFVAHILAIYTFGSKKHLVPRPAKDVLQLQLANDSSEWLALENPALFALPNLRDFAAGFWLQTPVVTNDTYRYNESPHYLPLPTTQFGAPFRQFMQTNPLIEMRVAPKPSPEFATPAALTESTLPQNSRMKIIGALAQRKLLVSVAVPTLTANDVIPPSRVRALVNRDGKVISVISLPPSDDTENLNRDREADSRALTLARQLQFAPAAQLTLGKIIFIWQTVPEISTNTPAKQ